MSKQLRNLLLKLEPYVDYFLAGYADFTIVTLIDKIKNKQEIIPSTVKNGLNIIIPSNFGEWKSAKTQVPVSLFSKKDAILPRHWLPLEVSRGCAFNCKFCSQPMYAADYKDGEVTVSCRTSFCPGIIDYETFTKIDHKKLNIKEMTNQYLFDSMMRF